MIIGKVIGGKVSGKVYIRLKSNTKVSVGDIVVCKDKNAKFLLKIVDIYLSSQIPNQFIEQMAGQYLEKATEKLFDNEERFYKICEAKILKIHKENNLLPPRTIPNMFANVEFLTSELDFLKSNGEVKIGYLRLGGHVTKDIIYLPAKKLISHHMLVVATTGKGKSNFTKVFLSGLLSQEDYSAIVLDPHNEYYGGKGNVGLRDHPLKDKIVYFTPRPEDVPLAEKLVINLRDLEPEDFYGIIDLSNAQKETMGILRKKFDEEWIIKLLSKEDEEYKNVLKNIDSAKITISTLRRKIKHALELSESNGIFEGLVFTSDENKKSIYGKIRDAIEKRKVVIIDTSMIGEDPEKIVASSILTKIFEKYKNVRQKDPEQFKLLPEVMVVFEEAPRVLGEEVLAKGTNIFEKIAREGRKFKIGLCAITQMPSLLPKEILSQMNTKVILGLPAPEDRSAIINSASQNISDESTEIQMLDKGEALITSPFINFPLPVKIFHFKELIQNLKKKEERNIDNFSIG